MALYLESLCRYEALLKIMAIGLTQSNASFFVNLTLKDLLYRKNYMHIYINVEMCVHGKALPTNH